MFIWLSGYGLVEIGIIVVFVFIFDGLVLFVLLFCSEGLCIGLICIGVFLFVWV